MSKSLKLRADRTPRVQIRKGRIYWEPSASLRRAGYKSNALGLLSVENLNAADELNTAADAFLAAEEENRPAIGTVGQAIAKFKRSDEYRDASARTRKDYDRHLARAEATLGPSRLDQLTAKDAQSWHDTLAKLSPDDARNSASKLRTMLAWCVTDGMIATNPAAGIKTAAAKKRKRIATREELWLMIHTAERMGELTVAAVALTCVATMQRVSDTMKLTTGQIDKGVLYLKQSKTGAELSFRLHPLVVDRLGPLPDKDKALFINERTRRAYQLKALQNAWARVRAEAARTMPSLIGADPAVLEPVLKGKLCIRDLRRSGMVWAAEAGVGINQICSVSGHTLTKGYEILETYMPRQRIFADQAIAKLDLIRSPAIEEIEKNLLAG